MHKHEIYVSDDKQVFFAMDSSGRSFSIKPSNIDDYSRNVYKSVIKDFAGVLQKTNSILNSYMKLCKDIRGPIQSLVFKVDEAGVLSSRVDLEPSYRHLGSLFDTIMIFRNDPSYLKRFASKCRYMVTPEGKLRKLAEPVTVYCAISCGDVIHIAKAPENTVSRFENSLKSIYRISLESPEVKADPDKIRIGCVRSFTHFWNSNKEFKERMMSGDYAMMTTGCPEFNGDKSFDLYLIRLDNRKWYRSGESCEFLFRQYAEYIKNFPGLSEQRIQGYLNSIPGQRTPMHKYLVNKTTRKLLNEVMALGVNGRGNFMLYYDPKTEELVIIEEYSI